MGEPLAELLRVFRVRASLTQEELAERAGVSSDAIAAIEQGRRRSPRLSTITQLADALELSSSERSTLANAAKGVESPTHVGSGLPDRPPPPVARGSRLPAPWTRMIGRHAELEAVSHEIATERLVSLVGTGGVGKTRLALAVTDAVADKFEGGAWWIELAGFQDGRALPQVVLGAMGMLENPARSAEDQMIASIPELPVLFVLDNCEHLIDEVADLVARLVAVPTVSVLATSREPLKLPGEVVWPVHNLAVPGVDVEGETPDFLASVPSVELFVERASRAEPGFVLSVENAAEVSRICRRLDGLPLAIELNAARVRSMRLHHLADELDHRLSLTDASARGVPQRHTTLWACIDWSYQLLDENERTLLRSLAAAAGPISVEAIRSIVGRIDPAYPLTEVEKFLTQLAEKSLAVPGSSSTATRYGLLDSVRAYATQRAHESGEFVRLSEAHADHFLDWLNVCHTEEPVDEVMVQVDEEYPNIRAALTWSIEARSARSAAIVQALGGSWSFHSRFQDARVLGDAALEVVAHDEPQWAKAVGPLSLSRLLDGDAEFVGGQVPVAAAIALRGGDRRTLAWTHYAIGLVPPFDQTHLATAYQLAMELGMSSIAALAAMAGEVGGVDGPEIDWLGRIDELNPMIGSSVVKAMCDHAWADHLIESGRLHDALELELPIAADRQIMPLASYAGFGRMACLAWLQDDKDLADRAASVGDELDKRWTTGGYRSGIAGLRLSLVRREPIVSRLWSDGFWNIRLGLQPHVVRTLALTALDQGDIVPPESIALQGAPPSPRSLMEVSFKAIRGAQTALTDRESAIALWHEVLAVAKERNFVLLVCDGLEALGCLRSARGETTVGAILLDVAEQLRAETGYRFRFDRAAEAVRDARAMIECDGVSAEPTSLSLQDAVGLALAGS
jgi:predicted ATPase/transcriptional regulator with XRE-family HTH domain